MEAAVRYHYGSVDTVRVENIPQPTPSPKEILIKVIATTINRTDVAVVTGSPAIMKLFVGMPKPKNPVTGTDFVGEIVGVGPQVNDFQMGDRVWGFIDNGCGSQAEYFCTSAFSNLRKLSKNIDPFIAAASIEAAHYAINFINKMALQPGDEVLVIGGTGAIGSATIQLLKTMQIHVTAVSLGHVDKVLALGADQVIDANKENFTRVEKRFKAVFDAVGKSRFRICKPLLTERGTYTSSELGPNWENPLLALKSLFWGKQKVKFPIPLDVQQSLRQMEQLLLEGKFNPLVDRTVKLSQIAETYAYVASGQKIGNVILDLSKT
ncbi:NAD(P)-dependent alcohol dehydrogenase [Algoriphagus jejuensis]|uniref:NAD(P)-dependent alcohol dehydrogenase n=1 Tax=Algoriphagus jejuensis TaxID=419934 RepID=A0ABN1N404_9BACT